jgi:hypothetical protein
METNDHDVQNDRRLVVMLIKVNLDLHHGPIDEWMGGQWMRGE